MNLLIIIFEKLIEDEILLFLSAWIIDLLTFYVLVKKKDDKKAALICISILIVLFIPTVTYTIFVIAQIFSSGKEIYMLNINFDQSISIGDYISNIIAVLTFSVTAILSYMLYAVSRSSYELAGEVKKKEDSKDREEVCAHATLFYYDFINGLEEVKDLYLGKVINKNDKSLKKIKFNEDYIKSVAILSTKLNISIVDYVYEIYQIFLNINEYIDNDDEDGLINYVDKISEVLFNDIILKYIQFDVISNTIQLLNLKMLNMFYNICLLRIKSREDKLSDLNMSYKGNIEDKGLNDDGVLELHNYNLILDGKFKDAIFISGEIRTTDNKYRLKYNDGHIREAQVYKDKKYKFVKLLGLHKFKRYLEGYYNDEYFYNTYDDTNYIEEYYRGLFSANHIRVIQKDKVLEFEKDDINSLYISIGEFKNSNIYNGYKIFEGREVTDICILEKGIISYQEIVIREKDYKVTIELYDENCLGECVIESYDDIVLYKGGIKSDEFNKYLFVKEGQGIEYHLNGNKKYRGTYINNLYHGNGKLYTDTDELIFEGEFINGFFYNGCKFNHPSECYKYEDDQSKYLLVRKFGEDYKEIYNKKFVIEGMIKQEFIRGKARIHYDDIYREIEIDNELCEEYKNDYVDRKILKT